METYTQQHWNCTIKRANGTLDTNWELIDMLNGTCLMRKYCEVLNGDMHKPVSIEELAKHNPELIEQALTESINNTLI